MGTESALLDQIERVVPDAITAAGPRGLGVKELREVDLGIVATGAQRQVAATYLREVGLVHRVNMPNGRSRPRLALVATQYAR